MAFETKDGLIKIISYVGIVKDNRILLVQYEEPPNPNTKGWWVPGPELLYGENPQDRVRRILNEFNIKATSISLNDIQSFVAGSGWHVVFSYKAETADEFKGAPNIKSHGWFLANDFPPADQMAHGKWEHALARSFLSIE